MRFGAITLVGSVAGGLTLLLLLALLWVARRLRADMKVIRQRIEAEQQQRDEIRKHVASTLGMKPARHLRLTHKLPPTLLALSALSWELVKRHPVPSLGLTGAAAGLAASAVLITHPAVRPPAGTNPGRAVQPVTAVHVPAPGRTTPVRKEAVPAGTQPPDVPAGTATTPVSLPPVIVPTPTRAPNNPPTSHPPRRPVLPIPVRSLIPSIPPLPPLPSLPPSVCVTVVLQICTP